MPKNNPNPQFKISGGRPPKRRGRERHLSIRSELRAEPDITKIARAVVALAMAQAEKEAAQQVAADREVTETPNVT